jgi:PAS domain S-box-containing protein
MLLEPVAGSGNSAGVLPRPLWQPGILAQTVIRLVIGTAVVVGLATWISYEASVAANREEVLQHFSRQADDRAAREQELIDRVAHQVRECQRLLALRLARGGGGGAGLPLQDDGTRRQLPGPGKPPLAVFLNAEASRDAEQIATAAVARDLLAELAPVLAGYPPNLMIAVPGRWLVGWGEDQVEMVAAMLPGDPVLLPAEQANLAPDGQVSWSRAFLEPASDRWLVAASLVQDHPRVGRIVVAQVLALTDLLARATDRSSAGGETVVYDRAGRVLAGTGLERRIRSVVESTHDTFTLEASGDALLTRLRRVVPSDGGASGLVIDPDGLGWFAVSRIGGPGWTEASFLPYQQIDRRARATATWILLVGVTVLVAQALLLVAVLRRRVEQPLKRLSQAAAALTEDRALVSDLDSSRQDEVGDLSRRFTAMADAVAAREVELRQANASLREREELARALIGSAADGVVLITDGVISEANPRAIELFAVQAGGLDGLDPSTLVAADGESPHSQRSEWNQRVAAALAGGTQQFALAMLRCNGTRFEAEIGLARVALPGSQRLLAVIRDVTGRNELERQLRQGQKLESLGQLAGGVAHDFNNMLAGIMGAAELMLLQGGTDQQGQKHLRNILTTCDRAAGLTRRLLAFARKGQSHFQAVDAHQLVRDTVAMLEHSFDKRIVISLDLQAPATIVIGDAGQLQNAILNLSVNARDAMPDGGRLLLASRLAEITAQDERRLAIPLRPDTYLELSVSDSGSGIPPEILPRIFEPFFTTKPVGKGTGLGLAAVYGTVLDHGGSLALESIPGQGTTFRLYLPPAPESASLQARDPTPQAVHAIGRGVVLLVDDEEMVREVGRQLLEALGYEVIEAVNGDDGIACFRRDHRRIDAVLVDMEMPGKRGIDCLRELRVIDPDVVAVLCSGYVRDGSLDQLREEGFRAQLNKPYRLVDLERVLDEVVGRR